MCIRVSMCNMAHRPSSPDKLVRGNLFIRDGALHYMGYMQREKHDEICFPYGFIS